MIETLDGSRWDWRLPRSLARRHVACTCATPPLHLEASCKTRRNAAPGVYVGFRACVESAGPSKRGRGDRSARAPFPSGSVLVATWAEDQRPTARLPRVGTRSDWCAMATTTGAGREVPPGGGVDPPESRQVPGCTTLRGRVDGRVVTSPSASVATACERVGPAGCAVCAAPFFPPPPLPALGRRYS